MNNLDRQIEYWSRVAEEKVFSHPFHPEKVLPLLPERPRILDFGCGYGRVVGELLDAGFEDVIGIDPSSGMIETGKTRDPRLDLRCTEDARLPFDDGTFDLVLLFAVLTCIPTDGGLRKTIAEARRVLRGSGVLYVSDYPLQADARNVERYERWREKYGVYGTFEVPDGGVVRHYEMEHVAALLDGFERVSLDYEEVATMNGNPARIFQVVGRKG